ncbi:hypothetical protein TSUD_322570 [Trifolium subterraneum]|uniref:Uncharacterized protein n=1 Tax=Trifolium subterraneum TaxID=3900 RepID=A0A2Z6NPL5_TRISU|nr:hypothetical protein TSUD_322570 [Trifolium subterraneum]
MVLLRELDGAKDYPLVIHLVGSDWERQVRAHYTRADETINIGGYYYEMFGFTVKSSDFEFGTSDIDSDSSGNDSDCVIISSSEFSSTNHNNCSLIVADFVATISTSMEISSRFTTDEFISTFRQAVRVSGESGENRVMIDPVALGEFVTTVNEQEPHYFYMYTHVLQTLHLWLLFNSFECQILWVMNVAPCQLHPNSWAFLKAFQVACEVVNLIKDDFLCMLPTSRTIGTPLSVFVVGKGFPELMFDVSGNRLFHFYWSSSPRLIKGTRTSTLNEYERLAVSTLSKFQVLSSVELISREDKPQSLGEYMGSISTFSAQQRAALNTKRKNPEESGRISIEILKKRKNVVVDEEEAEIEDEPLKGNEFPPNDVHPTLRRGREGKATSPPLECSGEGIRCGKSKFEEDLTAVKAKQKQNVKAAVKAKDDEVIALKEKVKVLEGELDMATQGKEEASQKVDTLIAKVDALEMDVASQYDDGFRFTLDQADSDYVEYLKTYRPEDESWDSDPEDSQLTAESKLIPGKEKNSPGNKEG